MPLAHFYLLPAALIQRTATFAVAIFFTAGLFPGLALSQDFKSLESSLAAKGAKPVALNSDSQIGDILIDAWKADLNAYGPTPFYYATFPSAQGEVVFTINTSRCVNHGAADKEHVFACKAMQIRHVGSSIEILKVFDGASSVFFSAELTQDSFKKMTPRYNTDFALDPKTLRLSYRDTSNGETATGEIGGN